jgi:hypothetical protein
MDFFAIFGDFYHGINMGGAGFTQGQSSNPHLTHNQPRNNKYARHY